MHPLSSLPTPCLLLEESRMDRNIERLRDRLRPHGVAFRPHLKTAKSLDVVRRLVPSLNAPVTVSTLREAEYFAAAGMRDMLYAVGIAPDKLGRVTSLRRSGVDLALLLDSVEQARFVAAQARATGDRIPVLLEIDCDGHRGGLDPSDADRLVRVAREVEAGGTLRGVLAHAGESYWVRSEAALRSCAERECKQALQAAALLRAAGFACPTVSIGSTPTAHVDCDRTGITELRAGVYVFFDLVMAGAGACTQDDIALSVLATVIGNRPDKGWILIDAGWMALSRDRGTARQAIDQGYGVVCDLALDPYPDLLVVEANQEHGILALRTGSAASLPALAPGERVRILPNHACATAAQHMAYQLVGADGLVHATWPRLRGW